MDQNALPQQITGYVYHEEYLWKVSMIFHFDFGHWKFHSKNVASVTIYLYQYQNLILLYGQLLS